MQEPYNWDEYAQSFMPKARELEVLAKKADKAGEKEKAAEYYLYGRSRSQRVLTHRQAVVRRVPHRALPSSTIHEAERSMEEVQDGRRPRL
jgi:hypothetical protein